MKYRKIEIFHKGEWFLAIKAYKKSFLFFTIDHGFADLKNHAFFWQKQSIHFKDCLTKSHSEQEKVYKYLIDREYLNSNPYVLKDKRGR